MNDHFQMAQWAGLQIAVMKQGEGYSPMDMHPLPKGKLIDLFEAFIAYVDSQAVPKNSNNVNDNPTKNDVPFKKQTQRQIVEGVLGASDKPLTSSDIARAIGSKSVANVQKTLNAMIKDGSIVQKDNGFLAKV